MVEGIPLQGMELHPDFRVISQIASSTFCSIITLFFIFILPWLLLSLDRRSDTEKTFLFFTDLLYFVP